MTTLPAFAALAASALLLSACCTVPRTGATCDPTYLPNPHLVAGTGNIAVNFKTKADEKFATEWQLVSTTGPEPWWRVGHAGSHSARTRRTLTYGLRFRRAPEVACPAAPPPRTIAIPERQCVTLLVEYPS